MNDRNHPQFTSPVYAMVWSLAPCGVKGWLGALYIGGRHVAGFEGETKEDAEKAVHAEMTRRAIASIVIHDTTTAVA